MAVMPPERSQVVRLALQQIVAEYGPEALSRPVMMSNLLKDMLPDSPRIARMLVAAAEDHIGDVLREHVSQGMDSATSARLAAASFAAATMFTPEACAWVVGEFAVALGLTSDDAGPSTVSPGDRDAGAPDLLELSPGDASGITSIAATPPPEPLAPVGSPPEPTSGVLPRPLAAGTEPPRDLAPATDVLPGPGRARALRPARQVGIIAMACLALVAAALIASRWIHQGAQRSGVPDYQRGAIIAAGDGLPGITIAESRPVNGAGGIYLRYYPGGNAYAPVTGYDSIYALISPNGLSGIEQAENRLLAGTAASQLNGSSTAKPRQGASVYLTISPKAQVAAYKALVALGKPAAAVAIDPSTGAILALASYPTFNPNAYTTLDSKKLAKIDKRYRQDSNQPLLNRAINDTFPPGSTFKIVTSSAAFSTGKVANANSTIPAPQFYHLPGSTSVLTNDYNSPCGNGNPPIIYAFTVSCNTAFGKLGATLGGAALRNQADLFGFNNPKLTIPLQVSPSAYPLLTDPAQTALSAIGQFDDTITPLQEAMLAAAIANHGVLMRPYLLTRVVARDHSVAQTSTPTMLRRVVTPQVASYLRTMMVSATHNPSGTAYTTAGPTATSILIAGETGTAQNGVNNTNLDDAVFTCFAPANSARPQIAVAVIVNGGGLGAAAAAPIALKIIQAYLGRR